MDQKKPPISAVFLIQTQYKEKEKCLIVLLNVQFAIMTLHNPAHGSQQETQLNEVSDIILMADSLWRSFQKSYILEDGWQYRCHGLTEAGYSGCPEAGEQTARCRRSRHHMDFTAGILLPVAERLSIIKAPQKNIKI